MYATFFNNGFYLNGYVREVTIVTIPAAMLWWGMRSEDAGGGEYNALVGAGYEFHYGDLRFCPITSLQYTYC